MSRFITVALGAQHDRSLFECGSAPLATYLKQYARQDIRRLIAQVYVHCAVDSPQVVGFYTLSSYAVGRSSLPAVLVNKLGLHELIPAILLGRLAVDQRCKGRGLGRRLLFDALLRSLDASAIAGAAAVIVHAKEGAASFYEHHGFQAYIDEPNHLFLPMTTAARLVSAVGE